MEPGPAHPRVIARVFATRATQPEEPPHPPQCPHELAGAGDWFRNRLRHRRAAARAAARPQG